MPIPPQVNMPTNSAMNKSSSTSNIKQTLPPNGQVNGMSSQPSVASASFGPYHNGPGESAADSKGSNTSLPRTHASFQLSHQTMNANSSVVSTQHSSAQPLPQSSAKKMNGTKLSADGPQSPNLKSSESLGADSTLNLNKSANVRNQHTQMNFSQQQKEAQKAELSDHFPIDLEPLPFTPYDHSSDLDKEALSDAEMAPPLERQDSWELGPESPRPNANRFGYLKAQFEK
jgi:hypothetical protein